MGFGQCRCHFFVSNAFRLGGKAICVGWFVGEEACQKWSFFSLKSNLKGFKVSGTTWRKQSNQKNTNFATLSPIGSIEWYMNAWFFRCTCRSVKKRLVKYTNTYSIYRIHVWYFTYIYHTWILWSMHGSHRFWDVHVMCFCCVSSSFGFLPEFLAFQQLWLVAVQSPSTNKQTETKHKEEIAIKHTLSFSVFGNILGSDVFRTFRMEGMKYYLVLYKDYSQPI